MKISFPRLRERAVDTEPPIATRILESILSQGAEQQATQIVIHVNHHDPPVGKGWLKWSPDRETSEQESPLHSKSVSVSYLIDGEMWEQVRMAFDAGEGLISHVQAQGEMQHLQVHAQFDSGKKVLVITP